MVFPLSMRCGLYPDQIRLQPAGDPGFVVAGHHVHFAADAEVFQVDSGLDREAGVRKDEALVVGLEIVEVRAVAVQLGANVVAGAVGEVLRIAGIADHGAGGIVRLPAGYRLPCREGLLDLMIAASRALRTVLKTACSCAVGSRSTTPVQVMS